MSRSARGVAAVLVLAACGVSATARPAAADVTREEVENAIKQGVRFLKDIQRPDGSWPEANMQAFSGTTSLVTLALLSAGESADSPDLERALRLLRALPPEQVQTTYAVALHTMALAAAGAESDRPRIARNAAWLIATQIKAGDRTPRPGMWSYSVVRGRGDQSNSQYALLGLHAASEAGVRIPAEVWALARVAWEQSQRPDGSWSYLPDNRREPSTGSMTCAGISSLIISGLKRYQGREWLDGETVHDCGQGGVNLGLQRAFDWMGRNFDVRQNINHGRQNRYYYLYGLERAGRLSGQRFFGTHDWYREGAEALVAEQDTVTGSWRGAGAERSAQVATSFALLFLAKGRSPVLVNKLRHGPGNDWNNDTDDVRNLVDTVARDWKTLLTWQVVDPAVATVEDLLQAPVAFLNGHVVPELGADAIAALRDYIAQGGLIFAEACCGRPGFDAGFRALARELVPETPDGLHVLDDEHPVWRAKHVLDPLAHPLWGIERGCRTVVIYSPGDLSCYWNQAERSPSNPSVERSLKLGQNVLEYATGRELPADKLAAREVVRVKDETPRRGALRIAKLIHAGEWNVAPLAVPSLATLLKDRLGFDVIVAQKALSPGDEALADYPLVYMHGRNAFTFTDRELHALRRHLEPGGGTLFADSACGSPAFDAAFRKLVAAMLPDNPLVPIPRDDEIYTPKIGFDLSQSEYTRAAGGARDYPQLEGVKLDGHWAVIYSKYDIGCALERHQGLDCKGYSHESARRIALNVVSYSTLP